MGIPGAMSAECRRLVTEPSEGRRLSAYRDCVGVLTIGYGHTSRAGAPQVAPGMKISEAQADDILSRDLRIFEQGVAALLTKAKQPVAPREFDALVDLAFNIGLGALKSSSLLRAYLAGDKALAAQKFMDWNKAGGRVVAGLTARRRLDRAWFLEARLPRPFGFADGDFASPGRTGPEGDALTETSLGRTGPEGDAHTETSPGRKGPEGDGKESTARLLDPPDALHRRAFNRFLVERTDLMKGYRTLIVGLALAILPATLQYLGAVDWNALIGPTGAFFVSGVIAMLMRAITTTPVGKQGA